MLTFSSASSTAFWYSLNKEKTNKQTNKDKFKEKLPKNPKKGNYHYLTVPFNDTEILQIRDKMWFHFQLTSGIT